MSTGPKTPEGKARVVAAMVAGRRRWVERMKAEGRKFPGGRKLGSKVVKPTKPASAPARIPGIPLPKQFRHMTYDEFFEAAKKVLREMQERFERTGRLIG
jgi:hypothetical protein